MSVTFAVKNVQKHRLQIYFLQSSLNINTGLPDGYIPVRQYYNV